MNNLGELTNREYLNDGTEIQGWVKWREGRRAGRGTWKRGYEQL